MRGRRFNWFRVVIPVVIGVAMLITAASLVIPIGPTDRDKWYAVEALLQQTHHDLLRYREEHGEFPASLSPMTREYWNSGSTVDPFSNDDYLYERTATGFTLTCLGKDQAPGGEAIPDKDIIFNEKGPVGE